MKYESTMTSKGTITIAAPIRKALGLKPGQKIRLQLDEGNKRVFIDTGITIDQFEKIRDEILSKYPDRPKGLSMKQMRDHAAKTWLEERK